MNKLIAFGDSFTWGSELKDALDGTLSDVGSFSTYKKYHSKIRIGKFSDSDFNHRITAITAGYSRSTWTALYANKMNMEYRCFANPGCSNSTISRKFFKYLPHITVDDFVVLNWTFIDRWDIYDENYEDEEMKILLESETMIDVDVSTNPYRDSWRTVRPYDKSEISTLYFKYLQSELWNKFETLKLMLLVSSILKNMNISFMMTCTDELILDKKYHCPDYVDTIQNIVEPDIFWFNGMGFNSWAQECGFPMGKKNGHPLEEAHQQAFEYVMENYEFT